MHKTVGIRITSAKPKTHFYEYCSLWLVVSFFEHSLPFIFETITATGRNLRLAIQRLFFSLVFFIILLFKIEIGIKRYLLLQLNVSGI